MDIEGAEVRALSGMSGTLARSPNLKLLVECNQHLTDTRHLLALLHAEFGSVNVVGGPQLSSSDLPPFHCNLWAGR